MSLDMDLAQARKANVAGWKTPFVQTHEAYIQAVVDAAKSMVADNPVYLSILNHTKVVYGVGAVSGALGVTFYNRWKPHGPDFIGPVQPVPMVEVCATGQGDWVAVAATTLHELGHCLAGWGHGHDKHFKECCKALGYRTAKAVADRDLSNLSSFSPKLRGMIAAIPLPQDGSPIQVANRLGYVPKRPTCDAGVGTRGGKSRGAGSGSRLVKCSCGCGYTVRTTQKWLDIAIPKCPVDDTVMSVG